MAESTDRRTYWIELGATILLGLATVGSAWCAYQSTRWSGVQNQHYADASALRAEANRAAGRANTLASIDVGLFVQWLEAKSARKEEPANELQSRFRDEFRPAFEAWQKTAKPGSALAPGSPFQMPEYKLADRTRSETLEREATTTGAAAKQANQIGDSYILTVVFFASVLFFAGTGTKLEAISNQVALLSISVALFAIAIWQMLHLPVT